MDSWVVCGRKTIPLAFLLGQLNPSARDLNQISSVLLVDMFRHVETLGRTIETEVAFRFHILPSRIRGPASKLDVVFIRSMPGSSSKVQRFKVSRRSSRAAVGQGQAWADASRTG